MPSYDPDFLDLEQMRELLRWRKWPEEKPTCEGDYLTLFLYNGSNDFLICDNALHICADEYTWSSRGVHYWRPIDLFSIHEAMKGMIK